MVKPRHISNADQAVLERAIAAGCEALRDKEGRVVALFTKRVRMSANDRKRLREMIDESDADFLAYGGRIVATPNPANLIGGRKYYAMKKMTDSQLDDVVKVDRFTGAQQRIEKLKRHPELSVTIEKLICAMPKEEGRLDKRLRAIIPSDSFWADLAHAEMIALAYDAAPRVSRDDGRQAGAKRGGKNAGRAAKARAADWQTDCKHRARELLKLGRSPRSLAGILAPRFGKSTRQVRTVLGKAGILAVKKVLKQAGK